MIELRVNGETRKLDIDGGMPLLWALRDVLHYTGTKFGCGMSQCGACTVLVDGDPVRSCGLPASAVGSREVTTIEGLSKDGEHPLQRAWREENVSQCGYCQVGQIMNAAGHLKKNPQPTRAQIRTFMRGNICRCGAYQRIETAILKASKAR